MRNARSARIWMIVAGVCGAGFFMVANLTDVFTGSRVLAGCLQLTVNAFVCITNFRASKIKMGWFATLAAKIGKYVPIGMASLTLWRVLIPALLQAIR